MERANSRAAAINADRLRAAKPGNDSKGREKKKGEGKMTDCHRWRKERGETGWLVMGGGLLEELQGLGSSESHSRRGSNGSFYRLEHGRQ